MIFKTENVVTENRAQMVFGAPGIAALDGPTYIEWHQVDCILLKNRFRNQINIVGSI